MLSGNKKEIVGVKVFYGKQEREVRMKDLMSLNKKMCSTVNNHTVSLPIAVVSQTKKVGSYHPLQKSYSKHESLDDDCMCADCTSFLLTDHPNFS